MIKRRYRLVCFGVAMFLVVGTLLKRDIYQSKQEVYEVPYRKPGLSGLAVF